MATAHWDLAGENLSRFAWPPATSFSYSAGAATARPLKYESSSSATLAGMALQLKWG